MNYTEMLEKFDVLYNNITSSQAPGLDTYEKCVFWNKGQLEVLKNHLNPKGNKYGEGFDFSSKRQIEFSSLIGKIQLTASSTAPDFCINATRFDIPSGTDPMLCILNEYAEYSEGNNAYRLVGVPISNVEYDTLMSRPFKYPPKAQAWRMIINGHFEVITAFGTTQSLAYHVRYVKMPKELSETQTVIEIPEVLHDEVLQRAVELAKAAYVGDMNQQQVIQALGERSE